MTQTGGYAGITEGLSQTVTQKGNSLADLSEERPLLLVFLRHFG